MLNFSSKTNIRGSACGAIVVLVFLGPGGKGLFKPNSLGRIGYAGFAKIGKKWSFRLCSKFGGEPFDFEEI